MSQPAKRRHWAAQLIRNNRGFICFIIGMSVFRSAFADWYTVPTGSMLPTIEVGDRITVNKMAYDLRVPFSDVSLLRMGEPERGDIVVFDSLAADNRLIKRVVGVPGDTISMHDEVLIINGQAQRYKVTKENAKALFATELLGDLAHAIRIDKTRAMHAGNFAPILIPNDHYLMMGDNRRNSADSRYYGLVPRGELKGKAHHVAFSLDYDHYYLPKRERFGESLYSYSE
ncbi:signal peptidase I [Pseudoalteromonas sp. MM17-2]|uniref:signal peptidase I n=1 Tax=Pseudoalteromonas sp. MM17-2 TaxID=2917753 RepID=UPI001EF5A0B8|nr:signal peptidase I [Pseudoalteromonas sp. MM17-2]MCG7542781.1 signal peptidase I [Pseudoalteromonas sp. MM17-2]